MRNFQRIGAEVPFGQAEVGVDEFRQVHALAAGEVCAAATAHGIFFDEQRDSLRYGFYFRGDAYQDLELADRFVTVQLAHDSLPDSCRLSVSVRTFRDSVRHSNKLIRYSFDVLEGEVMEAKKSVYLVLGTAAISFDAQNQPIEAVTTSRKMYERSLHAGESSTVAALLSSAMARAA